MEAMGSAGVDLKLGGLLVVLQRLLERLDGCDGDAGIFRAVQAEHRRLHVRRKLHRAFRPDRIRRIKRRTVEGAAGLELARMRGVFPNGPAAAAEADDAEPRSV